MTRVRLKKDRSAPLWVVLGAPLVGVPLMVGLLSLVAPQRPATTTGPEIGAAVEHVRVQADDSGVEQGRHDFDSVFLGG